MPSDPSGTGLASRTPHSTARHPMVNLAVRTRTIFWCAAATGARAPPAMACQTASEPLRRRRCRTSSTSMTCAGRCLGTTVRARSIDGERDARPRRARPDAIVPEHRHDNEQMGMVIRGSITFTVDDETRTLTVGGRGGSPRASRTTRSPVPTAPSSSTSSRRPARLGRPPAGRVRSIDWPTGEPPASAPTPSHRLLTIPWQTDIARPRRLAVHGGASARTGNTVASGQGRRRRTHRRASRTRATGRHAATAGPDPAVDLVRPRVRAAPATGRPSRSSRSSWRPPAGRPWPSWRSTAGAPPTAAVAERVGRSERDASTTPRRTSARSPSPRATMRPTSRRSCRPRWPARR